MTSYETNDAIAGARQALDRVRLQSFEGMSSAVQRRPRRGGRSVAKRAAAIGAANAAILIAAEAGATVSDAFGKPLFFNTPSAQAFGVLATTPGIHADAVDRLADRARTLAIK